MTRPVILILGASGFVGRALCRQAADRTDGARIVAAARTPADLGADARAVDLTQPESVAALCAELRPTAVINAAAYGVQPSDTDTHKAIAVNVAGVAAVMSAAATAGCGRVLHLGSCSEYGLREGPITETAPLAPVSLYGSTKAAGGMIALERGASLGAPTLLLRLFHLWGADEPGHRLFPAILAAGRAGRPLDLTDGRQIKDYSFVDDVAEWLLALATAPDDAFPAGLAMNVGSGAPRSLRAWAETFAGALPRPAALRFGAAPRRADEPAVQTPDLGRLERHLPDRRRTPPADGVAQVLARRSPRP